jgi:ATP-binding cassette subfamily F protein uup
VDQLRVHEAVERVRGSVRLGDREVTAGQLLEQLGFTRDRVWTVVGELSGGERRRLQLLRLLMSEPNVLLLDEPTNDLDTDTLAAVEDALDGWAGTLIVVSHDRYLLERLTDRQVGILSNGQLRDLPGGVEEYLRLRAEVSAETGGSVTSGSEQDGKDGKDRSGGPSAAQVRAARKELARLERRLARLGEQEQSLHAELAEHATDHEKVLELDARLRDLTEQRTGLEQEWFTVAEIAD